MYIIKLLNFRCPTNRSEFFDDCGCGCELKGSGEKLKATDCMPSQRNADICTMEFRPVCGWFDPAKIQCIKYPCAGTYSNPCQACSDEKVISWTEGECPERAQQSHILYYII